MTAYAQPEPPRNPVAGDFWLKTPKPSPRREYRAKLEREFRDQLDADFKAGKLGIENGWLFEYHEPCPYPCAGPEYGCPPACHATPIVDLWRIA